MNIKARWSRLKDQFNTKSLRERGLIAAAAIGGTLVLGNSLFLEPKLVQSKMLHGGIEQERIDIGNMQAQLVALQEQAKSDPDSVKIRELEALKVKLQGVNDELSKAEGAFVPPERMNIVLEALLQRHPGLRLVSLKTLAPGSLLGQSSGKADKEGNMDAAPLAQGFDLFRHGVEIRLEGSYADLYAYVDQLEKGPQKLLWGDVHLTVVVYPRVQMSLVVYTLGSEKAWLAI